MKISMDLFFFIFYGSLFYLISLFLMFYVIRNILIKHFKIVYKVRCEFCKENGKLLEEEPQLTDVRPSLAMESLDENKNVHSRHT